jgi:hypothetical protein
MTITILAVADVKPSRSLSAGGPPPPDPPCRPLGRPEDQYVVDGDTPNASP